MQALQCLSRSCRENIVAEGICGMASETPSKLMLEQCTPSQPRNHLSDLTAT